jgi:thiamine kinase
MSPGEIAALVPGVGAITGIERIKHGLTNESWLVRSATGALVVRVSNTSEASLQIHRESEALILDTVARAGIGPEIIVCDPARHLLVTRYMGPTWTDAAAIRDANIVRIAEVLQRLHALRPPDGLHRVELRAVVDGYVATLSEHGVQPTASSKELWSRAREAAEALQQNRSACLCHNDVHALNIVRARKGGLRLIDWEYAGLGEPLFDLASICVYHRYTKDQRLRLLCAYDPGADQMNAGYLELACWLFAYIRDLWMAVRALPSVSPDLPSASPPLPLRP